MKSRKPDLIPGLAAAIPAGPQPTKRTPRKAAPAQDDGRKKYAYRLNKAAGRALEHMAIERGITLQDIFDQGVDLWLKKEGELSIVELIAKAKGREVE